MSDSIGSPARKGWAPSKGRAPTRNRLLQTRQLRPLPLANVTAYRRDILGSETLSLAAAPAAPRPDAPLSSNEPGIAQRPRCIGFDFVEYPRSRCLRSDGRVYVIGAYCQRQQFPIANPAVGFDCALHGISHGRIKQQRLVGKLRPAERFKARSRSEIMARQRFAMAIDGAAFIAVQPCTVGGEGQKTGYGLAVLHAARLGRRLGAANSKGFCRDRRVLVPSPCGLGFQRCGEF